GSSTPLTHTFIVPLKGLTNEMYFPSGEIWAPAYSGFPKNTSRSMSGGNCAVAKNAVPVITNAKIRELNIGFILFSFGVCYGATCSIVRIFYSNSSRHRRFLNFASVQKLFV